MNKNHLDSLAAEVVSLESHEVVRVTAWSLRELIGEAREIDRLTAENERLKEDIRKLLALINGETVRFPLGDDVQWMDGTVTLSEPEGGGGE